MHELLKLATRKYPRWRSEIPRTFGRRFRSHISESAKQSYIRRIKPKFAARSEFYHICVIKYAVCAIGRLIYLDLVKFRVRTTCTLPQCWSRQKKKSCWRLAYYRLWLTHICPEIFNITLPDAKSFPFLENGGLKNKTKRGGGGGRRQPSLLLFLFLIKVVPLQRCMSAWRQNYTRLKQTNINQLCVLKMRQWI